MLMKLTPGHNKARVIVTTVTFEMKFQPFDDLTWNELWEFAAHVYPECRTTFREIQSAPQLPEIPHPYPPSLSIAKQGNTEEYLTKGDCSNIFVVFVHCKKNAKSYFDYVLYVW
jgi:hypothetical protein